MIASMNKKCRTNLRNRGRKTGTAAALVADYDLYLLNKFFVHSMTPFNPLFLPRFNRLSATGSYPSGKVQGNSHSSESAGPPANSVQQPPVWILFQYVILVLLLAIPAIIYFVTIYQNAYNFPYEDDFNSALTFLSDYTSRGLTAGEKINLLFSQYNEHRIVLDRLVFLTDYGLFGHLNFRHLILIGNVSLLLVCALFYKTAFRSLPLSQRLVFLLPVAYALFSFQYWELSTWSMAALQNLYVIPFALFSLYQLNRPGKMAFALACAGAVLATFTSGNGMFTFVAGVLVLLFLQSYRRLIAWTLTGVTTVSFYFLNYIRPPYHPDIIDSLVNHTGRAISYFFTLLGSMVGIGHPKLAILLGVGLLVITLGLVGYLWYRNQLRTHVTLLGWLAFLYLTCLSLMASRSGMGVEQAFSPRYGIVVVMLFATQAVLALNIAPKGYWRLGTLAAYFGVALFLYVSPTNRGNRQRIVDRTVNLQYSTAFYNQNPANLFLHWGTLEVAKPMFNDAMQKGIFRVPALTFNDLKSTPQPFNSAPLVNSVAITSNVKPYTTPDFLIFYRAWALWNGSSPKDMAVQLVAQSAAGSYVFDTHKHVWDDVTDHTLGKKYEQPGFSCVIDKRDLKQGHYVLWLRLTDGKKVAYQRTEVEM